MVNRRCLRTLDRPVTFFGLEIEDIVLIVLVSGAILFLVSPVVAVVFALAAHFVLRRLKEGRPPGTLYALLLRWGVLWILPGLAAPGLVVPPPGRRRLRFSCVDGPDDAASRFERGFWSRRLLL